MMLLVKWNFSNTFQPTLGEDRGLDKLDDLLLEHIGGVKCFFCYVDFFLC